MTPQKAKQSLDSLIKKARVHFYKPIQIAEILHHKRTVGGFELNDLESYRNSSKRWRDDVSMRLIGRKSTSSQKYQDNVFDNNAVPPEVLIELERINMETGGGVEAYVYKEMLDKYSELLEVYEYIKNTPANEFDLDTVVNSFTSKPGLRRSIDKIYEIAVYGLFSTIVRALDAKITLKLGNVDSEILQDFEFFVTSVLGISSEQTEITLPANLYRVGATNAADRGLDMWSNFGPIVQVKHLTITAELAEDIVEGIAADKIVIVCLDAEREIINSILTQVGWGEKIQGIITLSDLKEMYDLCLGETYCERLGNNLIGDLSREFVAEFPSGDEMMPFLEERSYNEMEAPNW